MNLRASYKKHTLQFSFSAGTSRGVLNEKPSWLISIWNEKNPDIVGVGECSIVPKLSIDDLPDLETKIAETVSQINLLKDNFREELKDFPAIRFAVETALFDWQMGGKQILFPSEFTKGEEAIPINGLIWMNDFDHMWHEAEEKFKAGFTVLKMKVGALDFDDELYFVKKLREVFPKVELRLDANGGFPVDEALERLKALAEYKIHSIEQPIKQGQIGKMSELCRKSPVNIALDEELIGVNVVETRHALSLQTHALSLLQTIRPQYIILKPSLIGGFAACDEWISICNQLNIRWWVTSALESNIGLNAIAQWTYTKNHLLPQGLGTGGLYVNNIVSPLEVRNGALWYNP